MSRPRRACASFAAALALLLALPAADASASAYSRVLQTYEQTGTIAPCKFSSTELSNALGSVDTYGEQYFADFTDAIQNALAARAGGQCSAGSPQSQTAVGVGSQSPQLPIGPVTSATDAGAPLPIVLLGAFAAAIALAAALSGAWSLRSRDPRWVETSRHGWGEFGYRAGGAWSEFRDWLRSA